MISSWLSGIGVAMALLLIRQGLVSPRRGMSILSLPVLCSFAYIGLSVDWQINDFESSISSLRDIAWSLVEVGFMIALFSIIREYRRKVSSLTKQVNGLLARMKREGLACMEIANGEEDLCIEAKEADRWYL